MLRPGSLIVDLWLLLLAVWLVGAIGAKRIARRQSAGSRVVQMLLVVSAYFLLFDSDTAIGWLGWRFTKQSAGSVWTGVALTAAGVALAIWARAVLGGNWSATVTVKNDHELVQRGPYRLVRHPIYSGFSLAAVGTALAIGQLRGVVAVALMLVSWRLKWPIEERFMTEEFGDRYRQYRQRVSAIIPGIW
jgi:protein-S-isoprenylcysteine O-methyltransferase